MKHLRIETGSQGVALVTLDNATEPMNVVSPEWLDDMLAMIEQVAADGEIKAVVITSGKPAFMAGADLKYILSTFGKMTLKDAYAFSQRATAMHRKLETCGKPFVAALNGLALGGGFELALACHARVLVDSPKAVVGMPEVTVGLLPGSGGAQRLARMIGAAKALPFLLEGASSLPAEALKAGLVDALAPADCLIEVARELALKADPVKPWDKKGYSNPDAMGLLNLQLAGAATASAAQIEAKTQHNYPAPIAILSAVVEGVQLSFDKALSVESKYFARLLTSVEARNIIRTTFVNKGAAEKLARRPQGVSKRKVSKLGVLGAGMMGAGIAHVSAAAGIDVVLIDQDLAAAEKGKGYSAKILAREVERGRRNQDYADTILARINPGGYADLEGADLVVEAVFEDTAIKADVTRRAEAVLAEDAIFASNTSTLPISGLAEASVRPANFIGLHFFSPVERMGLVEVIVGKKTSEETLAHALDFVAQLKKTPIVVNDSRGFYTSRVFQTFIHEGMALLQEGVAPALIENAAKMAGMPTGPLALLDEVTIDLPMKIVKQAKAEDPAYRHPVSFEVMRRMLEEFKRPSRKAGGGFYDYPEEGPKRLWAGLAKAFPQSADQPDVEQVKKRLLYIQALETARCLEENVLTHPADGDLGAVLGWGFPTYTGGTLSLIETQGLERFVSECDLLAQSCGARFSVSPWLRQRAEKGQAFYE